MKELKNKEIFYLKSWNKSANTTLKSNLDMLIYKMNKDMYSEQNGTVVMASFCDIAVSVKGCINNFNANAKDFTQDKTITLYNYNDEQFELQLNNIYKEHWSYKISKQGKYTHGIVYNENELDKCFIDWNNEGYAKSVSKYMINKLHIPMTEEVIKNLYQSVDCKLNELGVTELSVWTKNKEYKNVKCYYINNAVTILALLKRNDIDTGLIKGESGIWDKVQTVNDYLIEFYKEIKEILDENIRIRFRPETDLPDMDMFKCNRIPFKGQVPLVEGTLRTLKEEKVCMILAEMGVGKTQLSTLATDLIFKQLAKNTLRVNSKLFTHKKPLTLVVVPNIAIKKWKREIEEILGKNNIDVIMIEKTVDFIRWYNKSIDSINKPTFIITSMETLKLSYKRRPAVSYKDKRILVEIVESDGYNHHLKKTYKTIKNCAICPDCGRAIKNINPKKDDYETRILTKKDFKNVKKSNRFCIECGCNLWTVDKVKTSKVSLINYLSKKRIKFDMVCCDEFHMGKTQGSVINYALGEVLQLGKYKLLLSGTFTNGKVSAIFPILWKIAGKKLMKDGYSFRDIDKFIHDYGSLEAKQVIKDDQLMSTSRTVVRDSDFKEIPGISPILYTKYLSNICITAKLVDLGIKDLPKYTEIPIYVELEDELIHNVNNILNDIKRANSFMTPMYESTIVHHYLNCPFGWNNFKVEGKENEEYIINMKNMEEDVLLNKEEKLIEIAKDNLTRNRKCFVFTNFTGGHSKYKTKGEVINDRLCRILKENGINAKCLKRNIKPADREKYIKDNSNIDVWISNPILVSVSLDLLNFPSLIFYNMDYNPLKINQSAHRSYRANQEQDCETYYFYTDGIEEKIFKSVMLKIIEAKAIQGEYDIDDFNSIKRTTSSLGKELFDCIDIDNSFNKLNKSQTKLKEIKLHPEVEKIYNH